MQPGDMVRITRASIGVPENQLALIVSIDKELPALPSRRRTHPSAVTRKLCSLILIGNKKRKSPMRFWSNDLVLV